MGSAVRSGALGVALVLSVLGSTALSAQEAAGAGDPVRGKTLAYTCLGCHGIPGYKNAYPSYHVPKLEGQSPEYIVTALKAYKSGERSHLTMHSQASSLSDQDMADVAAYFAGEPLKPNPQAQANNKPPKAAEQCVACHGADGVGIVGMYPTLAGQYPDYLARALSEYKTGTRKNAIMAPFASQLTPEDIKAVTEYYSSRQPALRIIESPAKGVAAR